MAAIQSVKNFLRHGKQARVGNPSHAEATTNVSPVHAQGQQRFKDYGQPQPNRHYALSEPDVMDHKPLQGNAAQGDFSVGAGDNRNIAAKAGEAAARAAGDQHKIQQEAKARGVDPSVLERIIAEEREAKGKLPRYPGLERYTLLEKMGDGAFSNVYRAKDNSGQFPNEVAIKVVRKFEMNSSQVCVCT
jgi:serine/threonine-protein kinase RCK2